MDITVLGSAGGEAPGSNLTGFRIGQQLLLDAGTIGMKLSLDEQIHIKHVLLTHAHLDHIHALPFLLDNLIGRTEESVKVYSSPEILSAVKEHLFNGAIWPDFTVLPTPDNPIVTFCPIEPDQILQLDGYTIEAVPVKHSFAALAYIISNHESSVVFSGDTGPVDHLWDRVKSMKKLKALFVECSFPERLQDLAALTNHLCINDIPKELAKVGLSDQVPVFLYHLKPAFIDEISREAQRIEKYNVMIAKTGDIINC